MGSRGQENDAEGCGNRSGLRVAIIGAGVSGLAVCKHFSQEGLNVTMLEGKSGVGGVWRASYSSTNLQTPTTAYHFSDFPWPEAVPLFPSHHQVVHYLESYARHFKLFERIRFNSQVVEMKTKMKTKLSNKTGACAFAEDEHEGVEGDELTKSLISEAEKWEPKEDRNDAGLIWEVCVRRKVPSSAGSFDYIEEWLEFDYVVVCCGRYGDVPNVPSFPVSNGPNVFDGPVVHALHYSALDSESTQKLISGKKVVVVGFQKTALDIAVEVANINERIADGPACTMVFRRSHWMYPRHRQAFGLFPFMSLVATRLSGYWTPKPGQGLIQCVLQRIFCPVRFLVWKMLEFYLRLTVPVGKFGLVPEHSLYEDAAACVLPELPKNLLAHLEAGRIVAKKTPYWDFVAKGVRLSDGTHIEADVVLLCTGYDCQSKLKSILPKEYRDVLFEPEGVLTLYRGVIHPQIPNMGFVGYYQGFSSMHSSEMAAVWLAQLLQDKFHVPDTITMETERRIWLQHLKATTPFYARGNCVSLIQIWHADKLCQDMGIRHLRKKTWWQEMFSIYRNSDYRSLTRNESNDASLLLSPFTCGDRLELVKEVRFQHENEVQYTLKQNYG